MTDARDAHKTCKSLKQSANPHESVRYSCGLRVLTHPLVNLPEICVFFLELRDPKNSARRDFQRGDGGFDSTVFGICR